MAVEKKMPDRPEDLECAVVVPLIEQPARDGVSPSSGSFESKTCDPFVVQLWQYARLYPCKFIFYRLVHQNGRVECFYTFETYLTSTGHHNPGRFFFQIAYLDKDGQHIKRSRFYAPTMIACSSQGEEFRTSNIIEPFIYEGVVSVAMWPDMDAMHFVPC